jgi:uncharacterized phage-associated protein
MPFSAQAVANEFIRIAGKGQLDPMKLQKLVYFAHGWHLAIEDRPLTRQLFEAWQFGPVIPDLYRAFKSYGAGNVTEYATKFSPVHAHPITPRIRDDQDRDASAAMDIVNDVWGVYGAYSATKLSNATHMDGTPWAKWYDPSKQSVVIPNQDIREYFSSIQAKGGITVGLTANT